MQTRFGGFFIGCPMDKRIEIFAVGKWNGLEFTLADLNGIVSAFNKLGDNHKVPLKFGHNKQQSMTDGQPSIGWVKSLTVEGGKIIADVTDIPDVVMAAIDKKLYRNVSVELDIDVKYKDQHFPIVLSGIALLGADLPAVNTLKDLTHYIGQDAAFSVGRQAVFTAIAGNKKEINMDLSEITSQLAALTAKVETLSSEKATLAAANKDLADKVTQFTASAATAEATAKKAKTDAKRADITAIFEEGIKAELITPAQRGQFTKLLRVDDDAALEAINLDEVKALIAGGKKYSFGRDQGKQSVDEPKEEGSPDEIVFQRSQDLVDKKEAPDLFAAQIIVFRRDPELAKAYVHFNGRKA